MTWLIGFKYVILGGQFPCFEVYLRKHMQYTQGENVCIRCGKKRIVVKTWSEKVNNSILTYTETSCPDKNCQKIVESDNNAKREKRLEMENKRNQSKAKKHTSIRIS